MFKKPITASLTNDKCQKIRKYEENLTSIINKKHHPERKIFEKYPMIEVFFVQILLFALNYSVL